MTAYQVAKWERTVDVARSCGVLVEPNSMFEIYEKKMHEIGRFTTIDEVYAFVCGYKAGMSQGQNTRKKGGEG